jgi:hypothetical protein
MSAIGVLQIGLGRPWQLRDVGLELWFRRNYAREPEVDRIAPLRYDEVMSHCQLLQF